MTREEFQLLLNNAEAACSRDDIHSAEEHLQQAVRTMSMFSRTGSGTYNNHDAAAMLATTYVRLTSSSLSRGNTDAAMFFAEPGLAQAKHSGMQQQEADLLNMIGIVYLHREQHRDAIGYLEQALTINTALGNRSMMAGNYHNIGDLYLHFSEYARALDYLQKALKINEELGNTSWAALNLARIALVYTQLLEYDHALEHYQQARALQAKLGNQSEEVSLLVNMSLVYQGRKDYPHALELLHQALSILESTGQRKSTAEIFNNCGSAYFELGQTSTALEYIHKALAMYEEFGILSGKAAALGSLGEIYAQKDIDEYHPEKAEEYLLQSLALFEHTGEKQQIFRLHHALATLYEHEKRWEDFAVHFKQYHTLEKEVMSDESRRTAERYIRERQDAERDKALAVERALSQATSAILANILPPIITERLVQGEKKIADTHEHVSVLFVDIVGFTELSTQLSAHELIDLLDHVFSRFDTICKKHGLEKIKTIGDAYMAVCGAPVSYDNHAERAAHAAIEMLENTGIEQQFSTSIHLEFRIGLHTGSVVAGIIGENKYSYDLWGDAVNTASRMESHGKAGKIHVSEEFKHAVETQNFASLQFIPRGEIDIKGKGTMRTYFLERVL